MTIVLLGATGHTGAATARALVEGGVRPTLAGRDAERLAAVADACGGVPTRQVDVTTPDALAGLLGREDVLVSTVGPFLRLGEPAVAAAVAAGAGYLDSTGEQPFIRRVFEHHGPAAERTGARLLTAFGYDYLPGNLAAALAVSRAGAEAVAVRVGYFLSNQGGRAMSRGTARSVAGLLGTPGYGYSGGAMVTEPTGTRLTHFHVGGRERPAVSLGATEQWSLPRRFPQLREVDVYLGWFGGASRLVHLSTKGQRSGRGGGWVRAAAGRLAELLPAAPDGRPRSSWVLAEARDVDGRVLTEVVLRGPEPYELTARLLAWGAQALPGGGAPAGALGPAEAFDLVTLTEGAATAGLVEVTRRPELSA